MTPPTRAEVRARLTAFAARWDQRPGHEQQEAQQYQLELLECYGIDVRKVPSPFTFEHRYPDGGRADLLWPGFLLVEMKSAGETERLEAHRPQVLHYWNASADPATNTPSPTWLVLCSFRRLEIWQPGRFPNEPRAVVDLTDLPDRMEVLDFLRGDDPDFDRNAADLAGEAVAATAGVYRNALARGVDPLTARDFILQATWCMFAEDLGLLPDNNFTRAVDQARTGGKSTFDVLGDLFEWLNRPGERPTGGMYKGVPHANGGLFARSARIELDLAELDMLWRACSADWTLVEPSIFGGLLQSTLGVDRRKRMSAYYTPEAEIEKIVGPTIVAPWEDRIASTSTAVEARELLGDLAAFRVLDPACGCGNFLYVAYRELRGLEARVRDLIVERSRAEGKAVPEGLPSLALGNMLGLEKDPFAAALAQVVLWIGHKRAVDQYGLGDDPLPLPELSGITQGDALKRAWPDCDAIVGNPPFHGTKLMRQYLGDDELEFLRKEFDVGVTDYCVYWFIRARAHLAEGERAGLVATNSIREGKNREAALDPLLAAGGTITNAVSSQPWPGEANVHVSIVNWLKGSSQFERPPVLDGVEVDGITAELRAGTERPSDLPLAGNAGKQFFGVVPGAGGDGFLLTPGEALELTQREDADYSVVVRPYLTGQDITTNPAIAPTRAVITFGEHSLEEAERWPAALAIVRTRVKPKRAEHEKRRERDEWWKHSRSVPDLFKAVSGLSRFIACPATSKRVVMVWCEPHWCPSNATSVFAFDDDYSLGVLQSRVHTVWAQSRSTKLESRPRYTVRSFASFPWPDHSESARVTIGTLAAEIDARRRALCSERQIGLTELYNAIDDGAYQDLAELHSDLDREVAAAYGWDPDISSDDGEIIKRLSHLNAEIAAGDLAYEPFASAGEDGNLFSRSPN